MRALLVLLGALLCSACGASVGSPAPAETLTVFAASSLSDAFREMGNVMEERESGTEVRFNFLGSPELAAQIQQGAPADVFASADTATMQRVVDAGLVQSGPRIFARNRLVMVVRAGNPEGITRLSDLVEVELVVSLCVEEVPAGAYARDALDKANVEVQPDSLEPEVRAVLTRVALGEADAGIVYVTDVLAADDDVEAVPIPAHHNVGATYPIATLKHSAASAQRFVDLVLSPRGQRVLKEHGFPTP